MEVTFAARHRPQAGDAAARPQLAASATPRLISLAYYEASLLVEHIVARFGEPALRELVRVVRRRPRHRGRDPAGAEGVDRRRCRRPSTRSSTSGSAGCAGRWPRPRASRATSRSTRCGPWPRPTPAASRCSWRSGGRSRRPSPTRRWPPTSAPRRWCRSPPATAARRRGSPRWRCQGRQGCAPPGRSRR